MPFANLLLQITYLSLDLIKIHAAKQFLNDVYKEIHERKNYKYDVSFANPLYKFSKNSENESDRVISRSEENPSVDRPTWIF